MISLSSDFLHHVHDQNNQDVINIHQKNVLHHVHIQNNQNVINIHQKDDIHHLILMISLKLKKIQKEIDNVMDPCDLLMKEIDIMIEYAKQYEFIFNSKPCTTYRMSSVMNGQTRICAKMHIPMMLKNGSCNELKNRTCSHYESQNEKCNKNIFNNGNGMMFMYSELFDIDHDCSLNKIQSMIICKKCFNKNYKEKVIESYIYPQNILTIQRKDVIVVD